jgi:hypothetical protein
MKPLLLAASALFLHGFIATTAEAHPPSYGPDGLIPHSHTSDGTIITGQQVVSQSHRDCPETTLPTILGMATDGPCIRVALGRPIDHHVSVEASEPVLIQSGHTPQIPVLRTVAQPVVMPVVRPMVRPVIRPVVRSYVQPALVQPIAPRPMPRIVQPVHLAAPRVIMQRPAVPMVRGPELVTQFEHEGELLGVFNTNAVGLFGMTLIKVADSNGVTKGSWWTSRPYCFSRMAFLSNACWSRRGYHERFTQELNRSRPTYSGPGAKRSDDPCDHYTKLEAIVSQDKSGFCGY